MRRTHREAGGENRKHHHKPFLSICTFQGKINQTTCKRLKAGRGKAKQAPESKVPKPKLPPPSCFSAVISHQAECGSPLYFSPPTSAFSLKISPQCPLFSTAPAMSAHANRNRTLLQKMMIITISTALSRPAKLTSAPNSGQKRGCP